MAELLDSYGGVELACSYVNLRVVQPKGRYGSVLTIAGDFPIQAPHEGTNMLVDKDVGVVL